MPIASTPARIILPTRACRAQTFSMPSSRNIARPSWSANITETAGRGGRLLLVLRLLLASEIEVEARACRGLRALERRRAHGDHRDAGRRHPALLRAGDQDIDAERVGLQRQAAGAAHAVDGEHLAAALDDAGNRSEVVGHAGRRLVVGHEHRGDLGVLGERALDVLGVDRLAQGHSEAHHLGAVGVADLRPALAERAHDAEQRLLAGAEQVHGGGLEATGATARVQQDVVLGAQRPAQATDDVIHHRGELRAAVVDHGTARGADHASGERGRTGNAELWFTHGPKSTEGRVRDRPARQGVESDRPAPVPLSSQRAFTWGQREKPSPLRAGCRRIPIRDAAPPDQDAIAATHRCVAAAGAFESPHVAATSRRRRDARKSR